MLGLLVFELPDLAKWKSIHKSLTSSLSNGIPSGCDSASQAITGGLKSMRYKVILYKYVHYNFSRLHHNHPLARVLFILKMIVGWVTVSKILQIKRFQIWGHFHRYCWLTVLFQKPKVWNCSKIWATLCIQILDFRTLLVCRGLDKPIYFSHPEIKSKDKFKN